MQSILKKYSVLSLSLFVCICLIASNTAVTYAQDDIEYNNMEQMMGSIRLEKKQVESMLDKMVLSGRISAEEGVQAKLAMASMNENDLENLKSKAIAEVKSQKLLDH